MGLSLLIVTGSSRRMGNSEMFAKDIALRARADSISLLRLTDFILKPCTGCYRCLQPGTAAASRTICTLFLKE